MIGGNYEHDDVHDTQLLRVYATKTGIGPFRARYLDKISKQIVAAPSGFESLDYNLTETVTLQASARYTSSKRIFNGCFVDGGDGNFATAFGVLSNAVHNGVFAPPLPGNPSYIPPGGCVTFDTNNLPVQNVHK